MKWTTGDGRHDGLIAANLARMSEENRTWTARYVLMRHVQGLRPATVYNYAHVLRLLDDWLNGRPFREATADDVLFFIAEEKQRIGEATLVMRVRLLKRALKDLWDGKFPEGFVAVLRTREPKPATRSLILEEHQLHLLLEEATRLRRSMWLARTEHAQALLLVLWDSGFRISEALSLKFKDVEFDDAGAWLRLDPRHPRLKTGARDVYVVECTAALKAWMTLHPTPGKDAYLFISSVKADPAQPLSQQGADNFLKRLAARVGLDTLGGKALSCHDFRHSCATRKARAGWMEEQLRQYFGWGPSSTMPSRYVHLAQDDLRLQVRRDAGLDMHGFSRAVVLHGGVNEEPKAMLPVGPSNANPNE